jgi:hypothetical protein
MYFNLGLVVLAAAVASASPGPLQALDKTDDFQTEMMAAHNFFRDQHGVEPLTWDDELAESAQNWADTCKIEQKVRWEISPNRPGHMAHPHPHRKPLSLALTAPRLPTSLERTSPAWTPTAVGAPL